MLSLWQKQQQHMRNKRAAVSSDERQLATGNKRRRLVKAAVKPKEEFGLKKEEVIEGGLHQLDRYELEDCRKRAAAVEEEIKVAMNDPDVGVAEVAPATVVPPEIDSGYLSSICYTLRTLLSSRPTPNCRSQQGYMNSAPNGIDAQKNEDELKEDGEDDLLQDNHDREDGRKRPIAVKKEEEDEVDHELEDSIQPPAAAKEEENDETEVKEHGETDFQRDINEAEDSMKPLAAIKKEEEDETEEKEDREERIELVEDETRNVAKEMEVQMQYEITCLLKSSRVVTFSQMLQNQRMLIKLETLPEQVDGYEAKINRMQDDHEEALVREKELEDLLDKELQCLQELYSEIEENDLAEVNGDEESSEEQVEEHPEQDPHEMAADDGAGSSEAKAEGCGAKEENTEVCHDQEDSEESSMQVAEENDEECTGRSLEETSVTSESDDNDSDNVAISPVTLVPSDSSSEWVGLLRVGCLATTCNKGGRQPDKKAGWNLQFKKLQDYCENHGHCKLFCAVDRFPSP
jgi:hypothetical protein